MSMTFAEAERALQSAADHAAGDMSVNVARLAELSVGDIRADWPVLTGTSQDGWRATRSGLDSMIINDVDYAEDVHDGLADTLVPEVLETNDPAAIAAIERVITARLEG